MGHNAELYVAKDVDFETAVGHDSDDVRHENNPSVKVFKFKIRAIHVDNANLYDDEDVTIIVTDVNDEAPTLIAYDGRSTAALQGGETPTAHVRERTHFEILPFSLECAMPIILKLPMSLAVTPFAQPPSPPIVLTSLVHRRVNLHCFAWQPLETETQR